MQSARLPDPEVFLRPAHELARWRPAMRRQKEAEVRAWAEDVLGLFDTVLALDLCALATEVGEEGIRLAGDEEDWRVQLENVESMLQVLRSTSEQLLARELAVRLPEIAARYMARRDRVRTHLEVIRASIAMLLGDEARIGLYADVVSRTSSAPRSAAKSVDFSLD